jgi:hypothetical protein
MAANAPLSYDTNSLRADAHARPRLLDQLNRTVDRLFGFDLQPDELLDLAHSRKVAESTRVPNARATLTSTSWLAR